MIRCLKLGGSKGTEDKRISEGLHRGRDFDISATLVPPQESIDGLRAHTLLYSGFRVLQFPSFLLNSPNTLGFRLGLASGRV